MNNRNTPLIFSKKISRHFGKNIWLKLEIYNSTGCHKDRECELMVSDAKKKGYSTVGCASTGNLAISLAFYAKKNGLKCLVWLVKKKDNSIIKDYMRAFQTKIIESQAKLINLYRDSNKYMEMNNIYNANPGQSKLKLEANKKIGEEIIKKIDKLDTIICPFNNGSHLIGVSKSLLKKRINIIGSYTKSKLAPSINEYANAEGKKNILRAVKNKRNLIRVNSIEIKKSLNLLIEEGILAEGAGAASIAALYKIKDKKIKNICCIVTGSGLKNSLNLSKSLS